jgi:hypothetical protein
MMLVGTFTMHYKVELAGILVESWEWSFRVRQKEHLLMAAVAGPGNQFWPIVLLSYGLSHFGCHEDP